MIPFVFIDFIFIHQEFFMSFFIFGKSLRYTYMNVGVVVRLVGKKMYSPIITQSMLKDIKYG